MPIIGDSRRTNNNLKNQNSLIYKNNLGNPEKIRDSLRQSIIKNTIMLLKTNTNEDFTLQHKDIIPNNTRAYKIYKKLDKSEGGYPLVGECLAHKLLQPKHQTK